MSYCRLGYGSDLYMYKHIAGGFAFYLPDQSFVIQEAAAALAKLIELKVEGFRIPDSAINRLEEEISSGKFDKGETL